MKGVFILVGLLGLPALPCLSQESVVPPLCDQTSRGHTTETPQGPSLKRDLIALPKHLREGGKELLSRRSLLSLAAGAALASAVHSQDTKIQTSCRERHPFRDLSTIGDIPGALLTGGLTVPFSYGLGAILQNDKLLQMSRRMASGLLINGAVTWVLGSTVHRERPSTENLVGLERPYASFPSGHTSGSFTVATVLCRHYGLKIGVPAYIFAANVALSRIEDEKHWASDVVAGAVIGTVVGNAVSRADEDRISIAPFAASNRPGLTLSYQF